MKRVVLMKFGEYENFMWTTAQIRLYSVELFDVTMSTGWTVCLAMPLSIFNGKNIAKIMKYDIKMMINIEKHGTHLNL